jgi:HlyD family secretion protein
MTFLKSKWLWTAILIGIGGYGWYAKRAASEEIFTTIRIERGTVSQTVTASASLLADRELDLNFETTGRLRTIVVKEGDAVSTGDVLATIESTVLNEEVKKAQSAVDRAHAESGVNDDDIREAQESVKDAKEYLDAVRDAEDQKVDAAGATFDDAAAYERDAQSYYDQVVADDGSGSAAAKSAKLTLMRAVSDKHSSEDAEQTAKRARDVAVRVAQNAYNQQKERLKSLQSPHQQALENSAISLALSDYVIALDRLDRTALRAPSNGTITQLHYQPGEVIGSGSVQSFGRLLSSDWVLEAKVPESDIALIKIGQTAGVIFDALGSDESLSATVIAIDSESTVLQDVVYYKVTLRLDSVDARLKPGMSGDVDMHIDERKGVLVIPSRSIKHDSNTRYAEVKSADGKTAERREVKIGLEGNDGMMEVLSGLREDDEVITETKKK